MYTSTLFFIVLSPIISICNVYYSIRQGAVCTAILSQVDMESSSISTPQWLYLSILASASFHSMLLLSHTLPSSPTIIHSYQCTVLFVPGEYSCLISPAPIRWVSYMLLWTPILLAFLKYPSIFSASFPTLQVNLLVLPPFLTSFFLPSCLADASHFQFFILLTSSRIMTPAGSHFSLLYLQLVWHLRTLKLFHKYLSCLYFILSTTIF